MRKRQPKQSFAATMAKPVCGLVLLALLWVAIKIGIVTTFARSLIAPLAPHGPANAGVIYKQMEADRLAKDKPVRKPEA